MPKVLNKYRDVIPENAIYIGRPGKWGNPFLVGRDGDRDTVVAKYRNWLLSNPALVSAVRHELVGRDLVCFCALKACHGDILLSVANSNAPIPANREMTHA